MFKWTYPNPMSKKIKKKFIERSIKDIYDFYKYFEKKRLHRELAKRLHKLNIYKINNELKRLRLSKLIDKNISESNIVKLKRLAVLPVKKLRDMPSLRNIDTNLSKSNILYALIRSEPIVNEEKYLNNINNELVNKVIEARCMYQKASPYLTKKTRGVYRKRLYEIENTQNIDRKLKSQLIKELESMIVSLKFDTKHMKSDYRDDNYANIDDIEYLFNDINDYYAPILTTSIFNKEYQRYHFRGDETRSMSVKSYIDTIKPYLAMLIDENKVDERKIQVDIGFNMKHIDDKRKITHFSKSDNVICMPSSDANQILDDLLTSLYQKYQVDLTTSRTRSSFVFERVEEFNMHFHKIDLRRGASYIETPDWLKNKKRVINPKNEKDVLLYV